MATRIAINSDDVVASVGVLNWQWRITTQPASVSLAVGPCGSFLNGLSTERDPWLDVEVDGVYGFEVRTQGFDQAWSAWTAYSLAVVTGASAPAGLAALAHAQATADAALTNAAAAQATANTASTHATQALQMTPRPILTYNTVTLIDIEAPHGYAACRRTFQDGVSRSFAVAPTFNPALGAVEGGLDVGVEAPSVWYNLYLVPTAADDALLCVRGSLANPNVGPAGYANFEYIGAVYNDAGSNLLDFHHEGGSQFKWEAQMLIVNAGPVGPDGATVDTDLTAFVPWAATSVLLYGDLEGPAGGTTYEWRFLMHAVGNENVHLEVRNASTICILEWDQAIHTPQHIWRQLVRTAGAAVNAQVTQLYTNGWDDGWLL